MFACQTTEVQVQKICSVCAIKLRYVRWRIWEQRMPSDQGVTMEQQGKKAKNAEGYVDAVRESENKSAVGCGS